MSLRMRLYVLVLVAVLPAIAVQLYTEITLRRARVAELHSEALRLAGQLGSAAGEIVDASRYMLTVLGQTAESLLDDTAACRARLDALHRALPAVAALFIVDLGGNVVCRAGDGGVIGQVASRAYFRDVRQTGAFVVAERHAELDGGNLLVAGPLYRAGELVGVVAAGLDLNWLAERLQRRPLPDGSEMAVTDRNGKVLVRAPGEASPAESHRAFLGGAGERSIKLRDAAGRMRVYGYFPVHNAPFGLSAIVGLDRDAALRLIEAAAARGVALVLLSLALALLAAWIGGRLFIRRPIGALAEAARRWRQGDASARVGAMDRSSEIGQLGQAFDAMADRIERDMRQKDMLLREVNHRVMNSLQLLSSILGMQSRAITDPAAKAQFDQARRRLTSFALVHRRLYRRARVERVDLAEFLREFCRDLDEALGGPGSSLEVGVDACPDAPALAPDTVIPIALVVFELVANAAKHARPKGERVAVRVAIAAEKETLAVTVTDDGRGLPSDLPDLKAGLGMTLVGILAQQLRGTIATVPVERGTCFRLTMPLPAPGGVRAPGTADPPLRS